MVFILYFLIKENFSFEIRKIDPQHTTHNLKKHLKKMENYIRKSIFEYILTLLRCCHFQEINNKFDSKKKTITYFYVQTPECTFFVSSTKKVHSVV